MRRRCIGICKQNQNLATALALPPESPTLPTKANIIRFPQVQNVNDSLARKRGLPTMQPHPPSHEFELGRTFQAPQTTPALCRALLYLEENLLLHVRPNATTRCPDNASM